jgi:thiamine biosynthesis lipoprotein
MNDRGPLSPVVRRARPLLGTLVEVGLCGARSRNDPELLAACGIAFDAVASVQRCLTRFEADSDIARFNALPAGRWLDVQADTAMVLSAAQQLFDDSDGLFDVTLGSAPAGWRLHERRLHKLHDDARFDLGGIGKGHAVDRAVQALQRAGLCSGWVNAGGDLRSFGSAAVDLKLRDEQFGGVIDFGRLSDGAFATSCFGADSRSALSTTSGGSTRSHVSVAAPRCLLADALTKVVAASGNTAHPLLARAGARAWLH